MRIHVSRSVPTNQSRPVQLITHVISQLISLFTVTANHSRLHPAGPHFRAGTHTVCQGFGAGRAKRTGNPVNLEKHRLESRFAEENHAFLIVKKRAFRQYDRNHQNNTLMNLRQNTLKLKLARNNVLFDNTKPITELKPTFQHKIRLKTPRINTTINIFNPNNQLKNNLQPFS